MILKMNNISEKDYNKIKEEYTFLFNKRKIKSEPHLCYINNNNNFCFGFSLIKSNYEKCISIQNYIDFKEWILP